MNKCKQKNKGKVKWSADWCRWGLMWKCADRTLK